MDIELLTAAQLTPKLERQVADLYLQLNPDNEQCALAEILDPTNSVSMAICRDGDTVVGIALLHAYKVISGFRGLVEDVVVASAQRGKGIGKKLMEKLLTEARKKGLNEVLLFTGHHRKPAIALYTSLGFELRKSGVYNLKLS